MTRAHWTVLLVGILGLIWYFKFNKPNPYEATLEGEMRPYPIPEPVPPIGITPAPPYRGDNGDCYGLDFCPRG